MSEFKLKLEAESKPRSQEFWPAIRCKSGKVYSQRGATHESLVDTVIASTDASFWEDVRAAERGRMMDNGEFIPLEPT